MKPWYEPGEPDEEAILDAEREGNKPCPYCDRMMSDIETARGACSYCAPDERDFDADARG